jgi:hypothetical protein
VANTLTLEKPHEWISFEDPDEERTWVFDVTFLLSGWTCIFGAGCKGVLTESAPELVQGCCSYGAHLTDDEDVARVEKAAATLTPEDWQFYKQGHKRGIIRTTKSNERITRQVDDACIFLNRPGFAGGVGCALHSAALRRGERPLDLKPTVCWQLPLRRDDAEDGNGHVTTTVTEWARRHWGEGGEEFHWWCTEAPEAFIGAEPVYVTLRDELVELVGAPIYDLLVSYLQQRTNNGRHPLPHPMAVPVDPPKRRRRR